MGKGKLFDKRRLCRKCVQRFICVWKLSEEVQCEAHVTNWFQFVSTHCRCGGTGRSVVCLDMRLRWCGR